MFLKLKKLGENLEYLSSMCYSMDVVLLYFHLTHAIVVLSDIVQVQCVLL